MTSDNQKILNLNFLFWKTERKKMNLIPSTCDITAVDIDQLCVTYMYQHSSKVCYNKQFWLARIF